MNRTNIRLATCSRDSFARYNATSFEHQRCRIRRQSSKSNPLNDGDIRNARRHCLDVLQKYDTPSALLLPYIPSHARDAYVALRAFNVDVARTADTTSTPTIAAMRLQFQRDAVAQALSGQPPKQPVAVLLAKAAEDLRYASQGRTAWNKGWFNRIVDSREKYLNNAPYPSLEALETYAEHTYSTLLYLTLQALCVSSVNTDHVASHIGKASGMVAVLRGMPLLAFPGAPNKHNNQGGQLRGDVGATRHGAVVLPLDVMAECGVREEDVLRNGATAEGLKDAVFIIATRANDHLITVRQMLSNLSAGKDVGHEFEHQHEHEHERSLDSGNKPETKDIDRAFGVFMPAIATQNWLDRLQQADFDIFSPKLRITDWKLPWKAFWAHRRRQL